MATRIRLQRRGRKGYAFYSIVIADARAPRDGRFIEKIGTYNPNTNPAAVDLNFERALHWVLVGAQPTDTVRNLLSREEAETKFEAWKNDKQNGLKALKDKIDADKKAAAKVRLEAEKKVNEEIAAKVAEKKAAEAATKAAEEAATKVAEAEEAKAEEAKVAEEAQATEETTATLPTEEAAPVEEAPKTEA